MKQDQVTRNMARGVSLLAQIEKPRYFRTLADCIDYHVVHLDYPFQTASEPQVGNREIHFEGAHATDMTVEAFVVNVRAHLGYTSEHKPDLLRVVSVPFEGGEPGQKLVFFEVWFEMTIVISGETNNFSGAGNAARNELEDMLHALSKIYDVDVSRLELSRPVSLSSLYQTRIPA